LSTDNKYSLTGLLATTGVCLALLITVQVFVVHSLGIHWWLAIADSAAFTLITASGAMATALIFRYYQPATAGILIHAGIAGLVTWLSCALFSITMHTMQEGNESYLLFLERSMPVRVVFAILIVAFAALAQWMWNLLMERRDTIVKRTETERLIREAELMQLRQQLQPHFLFNSLNSISALTTKDPPRAREMVLQLSDFLRLTLRKDGQAAVTLEEELKQLDLYIQIERIRFAHRLRTEINVPEDCKLLALPSLLLQPLVENALKHGLYNETGEILVSVNAQCRDGDLLVTVTNPAGDDAMSGNGTGFGLSSIRRRLFLQYSRNDLLMTEKKNGLFTTTLHIPQTKVPA
jgi:two-component system, LytTR family, sensor kinase